jgi:hypothetical protein
MVGLTTNDILFLGFYNLQLSHSCLKGPAEKRTFCFSLGLKLRVLLTIFLLDIKVVYFSRKKKTESDDEKNIRELTGS